MAQKVAFRLGQTLGARRELGILGIDLGHEGSSHPDGSVKAPPQLGSEAPGEQEIQGHRHHVDESNQGFRARHPRPSLRQEHGPREAHEGGGGEGSEEPRLGSGEIRHPQQRQPK